MKKHIDKINISYLTAFIYIFIVQVMLNSLLYILNFIMVFFFIYIFFLIFYFKNIDFLYFLLYFLLYFFLINIFNFYILIFILILIINYKKINLFYSKNLIYNYLILSIKNTNKIDSTENLDNFINNLYKNKFFNNKNYSELPEYQIISKINKKNTLYQTNLNIEPKIIEDIKLKNYVNLSDFKNDNNGEILNTYSQILNENKKIYYNFWEIIDNFSILKNVKNYRLTHFFKDFENDMLSSRVLNSLNFIENPTKENTLFKMLTKDQFYGSRGEKWAEIEIYWTKDEYLSFEDVPKNNDIFKNIVKYDLKKKNIGNSEDISLLDSLTIDEIGRLEEKMKNFEMKTDFINWDFFVSKGSFDDLVDQFFYTFLIILGFIFVQFYLISSIFNKFKLINFKLRYKLFSIVLPFIYWVFNLFYYNMYRYKIQFNEIYIYWEFPEWFIYSIIYNWWFFLITMFCIIISFIIFVPKNLIVRGNNLLEIKYEFIYYISSLIILMLPIFLNQERLPFWNFNLYIFKKFNFNSIFFLFLLIALLSILLFYFIIVSFYILNYLYSKKKVNILRLYLILFSNCESNFDIDPQFYSKTKIIIKNFKITYKIIIKHKHPPFFFFFFWFNLNIIFLYFIYLFLYSFNCLFILIIFLIFIKIILIFIIFVLIQKYLKVNFIKKIFSKYIYTKKKVDKLD